jgi:GTP-binding protein
MAENFIDYVKIHCKSGLGGPGSSHFRREKFVEKGGPDGGDGGRGGHVILRGNKQLWTLLHLKYRKHVMAEDGMRGDKALRSGKAGDDQILDVPLGTVARDFETGEIIGEINEDGEELDCEERRTWRTWKRLFQNAYEPSTYTCSTGRTQRRRLDCY